MRVEKTDVIIVGGGLVGLSAAAFLGRAGVDTILLERHETTSTHPRARGVNARTMELLSLIGAAGPARATASARALAGNRGIRAVESLAGEDFGELHAPYFIDTDVDISAYTPERWCLVDQDELEPVLAERAATLGAGLRFATEMTGFTDGPDGVAVTVRDRRSGDSYAIEARYLVAADGSASPVRKRLGIEMSGPGTLNHYLNIHFRGDLRDALGDRRFILSYVVNADLMGALVPIDNAENWLLHVLFDPSAGQSRADFPDERCVELIRSASGLPGLDVKIQSVLAWEAAGRTADAFGAGRVFLAGDAAHVMPPSGAFGSNTGVQDAHNLAWKLAAVLRGEAGPDLLGTYETERRPIVESTVEQAVLRSRDRPVLLGDEVESNPDIRPDHIVHFAYRYESAAVAGTPDDDGPGGPWAPACDGRPGVRAPHAPITVAGRPDSAVSLFGSGWVLVAGPGAHGWADAATSAGDRLGVPVTVYRVGVEWTADEGVWTTPGVAWLVRPDGIVGWRAGAGDDPSADAVTTVLGGLLSRAEAGR